MVRGPGRWSFAKRAASRPGYFYPSAGSLQLRILVQFRSLCATFGSGRTAGFVPHKRYAERPHNAAGRCGKIPCLPPVCGQRTNTSVVLSWRGSHYSERVSRIPRRSGRRSGQVRPPLSCVHTAEGRRPLLCPTTGNKGRKKMPQRPGGTRANARLLEAHTKPDRTPVLLVGPYPRSRGSGNPLSPSIRSDATPDPCRQGWRRYSPRLNISSDETGHPLTWRRFLEAFPRTCSL